MQDIEPTNLCETCRKKPECFQKGIFERQTCDECESMSLDELAERDEHERACLLGPCLKCGSENTSDCDNPLELVKDQTVGYCFDCGTHWCLECSYIFEKMEKGVDCPHWEICGRCSQKHGYLDEIEFIDKLCPNCEHQDNGCQLEDPLECEKQWQYKCPFEPDISECSKIKEFLDEKT